MRLSSSMLALSLAAAAPALRAQSATAAPAGRSEIAVSAVGEAEVTPDRARVSIGVQTQAATSAEAASKNATLQTAVINAVKALGIPAERITTTGYNVYPEQRYDAGTSRPRILGYNVQNTVVVDVWKIDQVGAVIDAALSKGANMVSGLSLYSSQEDVARRRALANAVARARSDAEAMATAAGGRLGDLVELTSGVSYMPPPRPVMEAAMSAKVATPTPISEGTQTLSATVTARWQFVATTR
jgi:uncharacterized protein